VNLFGTDKPGIITGKTQGGLYLRRNDNGQVLSEKPNVLIFPNPVPFNQSFSISADRNMTMNIFTVLGQSIGKSQFLPANQVIVFPVQGMAPGVYIARFSYGSKTISQRFVIQ
ncbi:MAG TPA: T9SS type A sorting domain-containing protein, partial [Cyclobacteriaceae bacterium]|nr:T9SS type A sorting domain-containing protein [Cyclobacteriaceae bacterium]